MEMSIIPNKATLVAQLTLFKSLGDMRMGEESEVTCVRKLCADSGFGEAGEEKQLALL